MYSLMRTEIQYHMCVCVREYNPHDVANSLSRARLIQLPSHTHTLHTNTS